MQDLVPIAYFRGAAAPMAWDLGHMPSTDIRVQCCGDAHLLNFGMFGAPDRQLVFDVNDFDETLPGPFEWDVKRLAASVAVAARDNGFDTRADDRPDEPLFLQLKEAQESVLAPFAGPSEYKHQGERVVRGQKLMQAASDPFLGWTSGLQLNGAGAKDYYVRQLRDMKGAMNVPAMDQPQLTYYAGLCGWALARSHARTGRAAMISGYLGSSDQFDLAIEEFAVAYAGTEPA